MCISNNLNVINLYVICFQQYLLDTSTDSSNIIAYVSRNYLWTEKIVKSIENHEKSFRSITVRVSDN
jgi:hypothetical protein